MKSKKQNGTAKADKVKDVKVKADKVKAVKVEAVKVEDVKQEPQAVATKKNNLKKQSPKIKKEEPVSSAIAKSKKRRNRKKLVNAAAKTPASLVTPKKVENETEGEGKEAASIAYLKLWQEDRKKWKFQKLRQIWLTENMLNSATLTDDVFPTWLDYMVGSSKKQKQYVVKKAAQVLKELEGEDSTLDADDDKYQRAKKIIQSLDVEAEVEDDSSS